MVRNSLVGKFFLEVDEFQGVLSPSRQGRVDSLVNRGLYLVQLFNWLDGGPGYMILLSLKEMRSFRFYENDDHLRFDADRMIEEKRRG